LKIAEACDSIESDILFKNKGLIKKEEVPYLMRLLLQYPNEQEVSVDIIPKLETDETSPYIEREMFEPYMLGVM